MSHSLPVEIELFKSKEYIKINEIVFDYSKRDNSEYGFTYQEKDYKLGVPFYGEINGKYYELWFQQGVLLNSGCFQNTGGAFGYGFILIDSVWYMFNSLQKICKLFDLSKNDVYKSYDIENKKFMILVSEYKCEDITSLKNIDNMVQYEYDNEIKLFIPVGSNGIVKYIIKQMIVFLYKIYNHV